MLTERHYELLSEPKTKCCQGILNRYKIVCRVICQITQEIMQKVQSATGFAASPAALNMTAFQI